MNNNNNNNDNENENDNNNNNNNNNIFRGGLGGDRGMLDRCELVVIMRIILLINIYIYIYMSY